MGSPLSSFLAEAVMQDLERQALTNDTKVKLWDRYVDDVLAIVKTQHIENLFNTINHITDGITFTMEKEKDGKIAFLDVLLTRTDNGTIETQVYRKKTHTDQILNYNSNHPTQHKISCLRTLFRRIDTHCNTTETKTKELNHLYETFKKNNYPKHFIDSFNKRKQQQRQPPTTNSQQNSDTPTRRITLPYIHKISEITSRILEKHHLKVAHKPTNKLKSAFTRHKDQINNLDKRNVVYMIPCQDCNNVYIGETSKTTKSRITEHKNAIKRDDSRSLPATHVTDNDHKFDWTRTTILDHADTRHAREFKEAWHSLAHPAINRHIDIPSAYHQLQHHHNTPKGSTTTNQITTTQPTNKDKEPENQPMNSHHNQPIRRSLRLRNKVTNKKHRPQNIPTQPDEDLK